ncbi:ubiquitin-like-conjugating enzyme ATG10 isoform X1 [Rhizophagus irregularis DAOM 181602=DAOM 197198]|uniref:Ubiquitin-like-conjugating enzyme ATG10 n=1 Tax=Rhizophagus irregularis (strain DAOM 181602 / DAOM 197198 / MUCL 43194) TaxID=747089 RepID=U9TGS3_RHIID|nr:ubiquitin-like-conjugating enzyme ATG10 isoform X1 [Rhizophagus irregularis DAOM 181602=DAOM 197198]
MTNASISTYPKQYPFLTRQEFDIAAKSFLEQSKKSGEYDGDLWVWNEHEKLKGFGYLSRRLIIQKLKNDSINENITDIITDDEQFEQVEEEIEDPSTLNITDTAAEYFTVDYHIIYSASYKVPVLYFNAYRKEPSRLEDIKTAGFHGGISQQDHPTLLIPFYYLHPCETATLMKSIVNTSQPATSNSNNNNNLLREISIEGYIRSWLSLVGNVVGLKIGISYFL